MSTIANFYRGQKIKLKNNNHTSNDQLKGKILTIENVVLSIEGEKLLLIKELLEINPSYPFLHFYEIESA